MEGNVKIVSILTFRTLKRRLFGWMHNNGHYMNFVGIKASNPVNVGILINSHPQNTNLHQLRSWIKSEIDRKQYPITKINVFSNLYNHKFDDNFTKLHVITIQVPQAESHTAWNHLCNIFSNPENQPLMYEAFNLCHTRPRDVFTHEDIHKALIMQNQFLQSVTHIRTKFFNSVEVAIRKSEFNPGKFINKSDPNEILLQTDNNPPDD